MALHMINNWLANKYYMKKAWIETYSEHMNKILNIKVRLLDNFWHSSSMYNNVFRMKDIKRKVSGVGQFGIGLIYANGDI